MQKSLDWFLEQIPRTVKVHRYDKQTDSWSTFYRSISSEKDAQYHFEMQSEHRTYEENNPKRYGYKGTPTYKHDPFKSDQPVVRIHKSGLDDTCISCEG